MYEDGRGVPQNYVMAHMYFNIAASDFADAKVNRDAIAIKMTYQQIEKARDLAREWIKTHSQTNK